LLGVIVLYFLCCCTNFLLVLAEQNYYDRLKNDQNYVRWGSVVKLCRFAHPYFAGWLRWTEKLRRREEVNADVEDKIIEPNSYVPFSVCQVFVCLLHRVFVMELWEVLDAYSVQP